MLLFIISPAESYRFSELLELHAVDTYMEFLEANKELLRELPVPDVALEYCKNYMYYFQEFQMTNVEGGKIGRDSLSMTSLYDVFSNIVHDEVRSLSYLYLSFPRNDFIAGLNSYSGCNY